MYEDCVGFYKVKVTSPKNIAHPLLPVKRNNSSIYGEGTWTGWYYSEELINAAKFGYSYEILEGYLFDSAEIFSGYIDKLYQMKEQSQKDTPNYVISKLLMNSLYGRFGMKRSMVNHEVLKQKNVNTFIEKIGFDNFINKVDIGNKALVSYNLQFQRTPKINMAISAAITANSRIVMSQYKNNPDYNLYYSDTDSIFIDKPLPDQLVSSKTLGLMKLEHVLTKFVALGPKVYGGVDVDGNEFTKTKGLKTSLSLIDLENLLTEDNSLNLKQDKWFNNLIDGSITIKNSPYNLRPTSFKRDLIYDNGILIGTKNKILTEE
uniref:DNA-directed DNA polymerase n=1 Tax=Porodaedalea pini TaxID=108901 RepID=A0A5B9R9J9_9AGAM|nr:DNA polymerase family B [Porodaedalea pini]QEG57022.1 DNA polymerase family B [Porodaedalea pini]